MERPLKESLTVEFKSDRKVLPMDDLYKELVAMANTDGGTLYLGIEDNGDITGVNAQHMNTVEMTAKIQTHTVPALYPEIAVEHLDNKPVLAIKIQPSHQLVMTSDGRYMRRRLKQDGTPEVIALQPYEIMQRLSYIQVIDPSSQIIENLDAESALSPLERERLRSMVRTYHGEAELLDLSDNDLDNALGFVVEREGKRLPTVAGLLLIGREQYIREYIPGNEVLFQVLDGVDVLSNTPAMRGSLLSIFEKVDMMFQSRVTEQEIQIGLFRVPVPNYEKDAFREGFVNALVHRDYYRASAVHVQLNNKTMFISSPGGFPEGVTAENILTVAPTPRNRTLADAVKRIGLAERTGRGVDKIYSAMLRSGHEIPDYSDSNAVSVVLRLNSAEMDEQFIRMLVTEEQKMNKLMPVDALIVLSTLKNERRASISELAIRIQKREADARNTVEWLVELGMVEGIGNSSARRYMLSSKVYSLSGNETGYTRQRGMTIIQEKAMIKSHIEKFGKITRAEIVDLCKCNTSHANYLLNALQETEDIKKMGKGKNTFYINIQE